MHFIKTILLAIAILIFGIASYCTYQLTYWRLLIPATIVSLVLGLVVILFACFDTSQIEKDKQDE